MAPPLNPPTSSGPRTALVAGGGIAGPALAYWLRRAGWRVIVVEAAPAPRTSGQNIDIRGAGIEVMDRMGITDAVRARNTTEQGTSFHSPGGRRIARIPTGPGAGGDGPTSEFEIVRSDLVEVLAEAAGITDDIRHGERVTAIRQHPDPVDVDLSDGTTETVDVVVVADGLRSDTRTMLLGEEIAPRPLGLQMSYFTIDREPHDDHDWRWWFPGRGRSVTLRPDRFGTIRATLSHVADDPARRRSRDEHRAHLRSVFGDAGWETPRVLAGMDVAEDFYAESVAQVVIDRPWSEGRGVLLGDAAWCASPISGMGTTLALVGAYVLGAALATHDDPRDAFRSFETTMRPYVASAQKLLPDGPKLLHPRTRLGVAALNIGLATALSPPLRALGSLFARPPADGITLPDNPFARATAR